MFESLKLLQAHPRLPPIIGALLLALSLGGCSAVRTGYNNAPTLAYWWLDRYFDFTDAHSVQLRHDLAAAHAWHRAQELPQIDRLLHHLQELSQQTVTPSQLCRAYAQAQSRALAPLERLVPTMAAIATTLEDTQLTHMQAEFARRDKKWRSEWLDAEAPERLERRLNRWMDWAESLYGPLQEAQIAALNDHLKRSVFDPERQFREIQRRHDDALQALQTIRKGNLAPPQAQAALSGVLERSVRAPDPAHRRYMEQVTQESCVAFADLHNRATAAQRKRLAQSLQGYRDDARALAPTTATPTATAAVH